jgi:hypothetical protein
MSTLRVWTCNCKRYCGGIPQTVAKSTYHKHAKYQVGPQVLAISNALLAAHAHVTSTTQGAQLPQVQNRSPCLPSPSLVYQFPEPDEVEYDPTSTE